MMETDHENPLLDRMNAEATGVQVFRVSNPEDAERLLKFLETKGENNED